MVTVITVDSITHPPICVRAAQLSRRNTGCWAAQRAVRTPPPPTSTRTRTAEGSVSGGGGGGEGGAPAVPPAVVPSTARIRGKCRRRQREDAMPWELSTRGLGLPSPGIHDRSTGEACPLPPSPSCLPLAATAAHTGEGRHCGANWAQAQGPEVRSPASHVHAHTAVGGAVMRAARKPHCARSKRAAASKENRVGGRPWPLAGVVIAAISLRL